MPEEENSGVAGHPADIARQTLLDLIDRYGLSLADDARRCEGLLRDLCGTCRREIHVLITAVDERVTADLLSASDQLPREITIGRLVKRLVDNRGLTRDVAVWAVESWALACGLIAMEDLSPALPQVDDDPDPQSIPEILPDTVRSPTEQTTTSAPTHEELVAQRRGEGLSAKAWRLLESIASIEDTSERLASAEEALSAFTEAMELLSGDAGVQKGLDEALDHVASASSQSGNQALRKRNFSLAISHFRRTLEIDPGNAEAESRLKAIRNNREQLITKARLALDEGQYKSSARVLEQVQVVFPDDAEIKTLLSEAQSAGEMVDLFKQHQLPKLETQRKLYELLEIIQDMQDKGLHIAEIDQYKRSFQKRIQSVAPILQRAETFLAAGDHQKAGIEAGVILAQVADHEGALEIKQKVRDYVTASDDASQTIRTAHLQRHWFKAKRLLLRHPTPGENDAEWQQLVVDIESGVIRASHYWRLLPMVLLGIAFWLLAGIFSGMFSGGIKDTLLEQDLGGSFSNSISESVAGRTAHLFLALVFLPFWAAILAGRGALRSLGLLFAIVIGHALLAVAMIWLSKKPIPAETVRFAVIYGAASGAFLAEFMKKLLQRSEAKAHLTAIAVGLLVATLLPLIGKLPIRFFPDVLTSKILFAIVFCGLLQVLGLVRRWSRFVFVPIAVFLAYGLTLGSGDSWEPYLPWLSGLLVAGAVVLLTAAGSDLVKILAVLMVAPLTTLLFQFAPEMETLPDAITLVAVWLAVWGSLAIIHRDDIEPNWHLRQLFRLWKAAPSKETAAPTPQI